VPDDRPNCSFCRSRRADAFLHEDPTSNVYRHGLYWLICFDCIELMIERENAVATHRGIVDLLPDIWDRPPKPIFRRGAQ
jgi:hypothetical protein